MFPWNRKKKLRRAVELEVTRALAGDQHSVATLIELGKRVREGTADRIGLEAYAIASRLTGGTNAPRTSIGVDAADVLRKLDAARTPDAKCGPLAALPHVGGNQACALAALLLADAGCIDPAAIAHGFGEEGCAILCVEPKAGFPETLAERGAQIVGLIIREAQAIVSLRHGDLSFDPLLAWEVGSIPSPA